MMFLNIDAFVVPSLPPPHQETSNCYKLSKLQGDTPYTEELLESLANNTVVVCCNVREQK